MKDNKARVLGRNVQDNIIQKTLPLPIPSIMQEESRLCWAACVVMIASHLGNGDLRQCSLANILFSQNKCCYDTQSEECNCGASASKITGLLEYLSINARFTDNPITFEEIEEQVDMGSPVLASWRTEHSGHTFLIVGATRGPAGNSVYINEPSAGVTTELPYSKIVDMPGIGKWDYTWKDISKM